MIQPHEGETDPKYSDSLPLSSSILSAYVHHSRSIQQVPNRLQEIMASETSLSPLLRLPAEIQLKIHEEVIISLERLEVLVGCLCNDTHQNHNAGTIQEQNEAKAKLATAISPLCETGLTRTNRAIRRITLDMWYSRNLLGMESCECTAAICAEVDRRGKKASAEVGRVGVGRREGRIWRGWDGCGRSDLWIKPC